MKEMLNKTNKMSIISFFNSFGLTLHHFTFSLVLKHVSLDLYWWSKIQNHWRHIWILDPNEFIKLAKIAALRIAALIRLAVEPVFWHEIHHTFLKCSTSTCYYWMTTTI